eukprot:1094631_1
MAMSDKEKQTQSNISCGMDHLLSPAAHWLSEIEGAIGKSTQWTQYFTGIFMVSPPTKVLSSLLRRCFIQGAQSGYYKINNDGRGRGRKQSKRQYTAFMHVAQAINQFQQFPVWIRNGCPVKSFNSLQKRVMGDLCLGNNSVIVSSAGCDHFHAE